MARALVTTATCEADGCDWHAEGEQAYKLAEKHMRQAGHPTSTKTTWAT